MAQPTGSYGNAPMPLPDWEGLVEEVDRSFVRSLRRNLGASRLFAGKERKVAHEGIRSLAYKKVKELGGKVQVTMDIPPLQSTSGGFTSHSQEIPVFSVGKHYDGRDLASYLESGLDTIFEEELAYLWAKDINKYLYFGSESGTGIPGPATSLLNHADRNVINNSSNWSTTPKAIVDDLNDGIREILVDEHTGPFALLMNPNNSDLIHGFLNTAGGAIQISNLIPSTIVGGANGIIWDKDIPAGKAFLVDVTPGNYDLLSPNVKHFTGGSGNFGLGAVYRTMHFDPLAQSLDMMWLNMMSPRVIRGTCVAEVVFTT